MGPALAGVAFEVDGDVEFVGARQFGDGARAQGADFVKVLDPAFQALLADPKNSVPL